VAPNKKQLRLLFLCLMNFPETRLQPASDGDLKNARRANIHADLQGMV
jgi:hypothetical protein